LPPENGRACFQADLVIAMRASQVKLELTCFGHGIALKTKRLMIKD